MSSDEAAVREALRWLRYAEGDLAVASRLMASAPTAPRHVCWLSQQAAEKALKAALLLDGIDFSYTHDLDALRNRVPSGWAIRETHSDLAELTEWAVEARYPGDWPDPTDADAERALSQARSLYQSVVAEFRKRGNSA